MNINLGDYYEQKLEKILRMGVATNKTEALRQAIVNYERQLDEEELLCLKHGMEDIEQKIASGDMKTYSWEQVKKKLK